MMQNFKDVSDKVYLIATIDVGTASTRVILFNKLGQEVCKYQIEYSTTCSIGRTFGNFSSGKNGCNKISSCEDIGINTNDYIEIEEVAICENEATLRFPYPGWVECQPMNILGNVVQCLAATLIYVNKLNEKRIDFNLGPYEIKCIGLTNMRETTIVWSKKTGLLIVDYGIVWNDVRTMDIVNGKKTSTPVQEQERLRAKTGLPVYSTYFSCSKLRWFLDNEPKVKEAYEACDLMFGTVDTWLLYNLTHNHSFISDITNSSRTGFMNLDTLDYDEEMLRYWDLNMKKINLPKIVSSSEYYGDFRVPEIIRDKLTETAWKVLKDFSKKCIPIQGCLGDQSSSLVGQMAYEAGSAKCTYGTGCFLLYNTALKKLISKHGMLTTFGYWFPNLKGKDGEPHFALEGSVADAGAVVQWMRDNLRLFANAEEVGYLACKVSDSGGVVFVPAFNGLFSPYWDPDTRGTIMGISRYTTAAHIARAAIEGVCLQVKAILKAMNSDILGQDFFESATTDTYDHFLASLTVDGGMSNSDEVMQIQADIFGPSIEIKRSLTAESTSLGAAIAANMAYKNPEDRFWKDFDSVKKYILHHGASIDNENLPKLKIFKSKSSEETRKQHWIYWQTAVKRAAGWLLEVQAPSS